MGMVYRRKYKRRDGSIGLTNTWWMKYYVNGVPVWESAKTTKERVARKKLQLREGEVARGEPIMRKVNRMNVRELLAAVAEDYRIHGKRSLDGVERRIKLHLLPFFKAATNAANVTDSDVCRFIVQRQAAKASNGEINRELAILRRGYSLARSAVTVRPHIHRLKEAAARSGFFEREQFDAVRTHLSPVLRAVVTFMFVTGWRDRSEVLALQWRQVDFAGRVVRLDAGTTKNDEARVFPFTAELKALLEERRADTRRVERERGEIIPWVFHRNGKRIKDFYGAWDKACEAAGCPDRVPHDFRRTAVRNMVRAGIPERVAMKLSGHKTRAVFDRYNIVSEADLTDAAQRLDQFRLTTVTVAGTVGPKQAPKGRRHAPK